MIETVVTQHLQICCWQESRSRVFSELELGLPVATHAGKCLDCESSLTLAMAIVGQAKYTHRSIVGCCFLFFVFFDGSFCRNCGQNSPIEGQLHRNINLNMGD